MYGPKSLRTATLITSTLAAAAVFGLPLATASATTHPPKPTREIDVTASDYALNLHLNAAVRAGRMKVVLHNVGSADHESALVKLHPHVSVTQFKTALARGGDGAALSLTDPVGGPAAVHPGGRQVAWNVLQPGNYLAICLVKGPDGMSHLAMGMFAPFRVVGTVPKPGHLGGRLFPVGPGHTITAHDMTFTLPARFNGHGLYRFVDTDKKDAHEVQFLQLAPGKHKADFLAWLAHPGIPPFRTAGGAAPMLPGGQADVLLNLAPGTYLATCFVPDDMPPHLPHALLGMVTEFTVH